MGRAAVVQASVLGGLSIVSGLLLAGAPRTAASLYALPRDERLLRALGARDVAVGILLCAPPAARLGCVLRALSDGLDLALITREAARSRRPLRASLRAAGALCLVAVALRLERELRPERSSAAARSG